jgi:hypothetical protein
VTKRQWSVTAMAALAGGGLAAVVAAEQARRAEQPPHPNTRERNLRTYAELMRSDIRTQKVALVTETLQLNEADDVIFWPIYRQYESELSRMYDERIQLIENYGENLTTLSDAQADEMVVKALDLESRRTALKQKYYAQLKSAALSPRLAARALHIEHQLELLVDLQIDASLPLISTK